MRAKSQGGFSLIEVLVAVLIFSVGMLGLGKMLILSLKSNSTAYASTQAVQAANAILDRMRANRATALTTTASAYSLPTLTAGGVQSATPSCLQVACSPTVLAQYDVANWLTGLTAANGLPSGKGQIVFNTANGETSVAITVQWDDSIAQHALHETINPASFTLKSIL
jgi:type IV pilus assembly protein PilV